MAGGATRTDPPPSVQHQEHKPLREIAAKAHCGVSKASGMSERAEPLRDEDVDAWLRCRVA